MGTILFLIGVPLIVGIVLLVLRADKARDILVKVAAAAIAAGSIFLVVTNFRSGGASFKVPGAAMIGNVMMVIEVCLAAVIVVLGIKKRRPLAPILSIIQTPLMIRMRLRIRVCLPSGGRAIRRARTASRRWARGRGPIRVASTLRKGYRRLTPPVS